MGVASYNVQHLSLSQQTLRNKEGGAVWKLLLQKNKQDVGMVLKQL